MSWKDYRNGKQRIRAKARAKKEQEKKNQAKSDFCNFVLFPLWLVVATAFFFKIEYFVLPLILIVPITIGLIAEK